MRKITRLLFVFSAMLCDITVAGSIPLANPGFENPVLNDEAYINDLDSALNNYGWNEDADRTWMIFNPTSGDPIQPTEGSNWMQLTRAGSTMSISQITTGYQIQPDTLYRITFDYAQRATFGSDALYMCTLYAAKNGVQNRTASYTLVSSGLVYFNKDNQWRTATLDWNSAGSSLVGQNFDLFISGKVIIDNIRIEINPQPIQKKMRLVVFSAK